MFIGELDETGISAGWTQAIYFSKEVPIKTAKWLGDLQNRSSGHKFSNLLSYEMIGWIALYTTNIFVKVSFDGQFGG